MTFPAFDATAFLKFQLNTGTIIAKESTQMAMVPIEFLEAITPTQQMADAAEKLGRSQGKLLANQIQKAEGPVDMAVLADYIGGTLTVFGLGKIKIEILGNALTFQVIHDNPNKMPKAMRTLYKGFLTGYLRAIKPEFSFEIIEINNASKSTRFWAGNPKAAIKLNNLLAEGKQPIEALGLLA